MACFILEYYFQIKINWQNQRTYNGVAIEITDTIQLRNELKILLNFSIVTSGTVLGETIFPVSSLWQKVTENIKKKGTPYQGT